MKFAIFFSALLLASLFTFQNSFGDESDLFCENGQVLVYRINAEKYACLNPPTVDKWYKSGIAEPVEQFSAENPIHPEKMTSAAPIPESAFGPQIDFSKGYLVEEIKDGLYWVTEGAYQGMFLVTGEGVIVVDAPPSIGENYLKAVDEVTDEPITHVIYSHSHIDHIGAANMFPTNATIISHKWTATQLEMRNDPNRPVPTVTFEDKYTLEVGTKTRIRVSWTNT